ncbi:hypothetical protein [Paraclostridium tenue]|uniref:Uncharacterized protein n=1 Tax=Paraclostridium tenue TaxID=1737 RepID=A0ABN1LXY7_9FIRM
MICFPYIVFVIIIGIFIFSFFIRDSKFNNEKTFKYLASIIRIVSLCFIIFILLVLRKNTGLIYVLKLPTTLFFTFIDIYFLVNLCIICEIYSEENKTKDNLGYKILLIIENVLKSITLIFIGIINCLLVFLCINVVDKIIELQASFIDAIICYIIICSITSVLKSESTRLMNRIIEKLMNKILLKLDIVNYKFKLINNKKDVFNFNKMFTIACISIYKGLTSDNTATIIIVFGFIILLDSFIDKISKSLKKCLSL